MSIEQNASPQYTAPERPMVFYDGGCPLCRREVAHYRRIDSAERLHWVDALSDPETLASYNLSLEQAMTELHVLDEHGHWQRGVDAFLIIWQHLPPYRWLAKVVTFLGLRRPLGFIYRHFAARRYRHRCGTGNCTISKQASRTQSAREENAA